MPTMMRYAVGLWIVSSAFMLAASAQVPICGGIQESDPPPLSSSDPTAEVDWWADADRIGPPGTDMFQMTRALVNRSDQARRVYWPVGRMDVTLKPGEWARHCPPAAGGPGRNIVEGPLSYKSNGTSVNTRVYENFGESPGLWVLPGERMDFTTGFSRGIKVGENADYEFKFTASVTYDPKQKKYIITYTIANTGKQDENVSVKEIPYNPDIAGQINPLKAGKTVSYQVSSDTNPLSKWVNAELNDTIGILNAQIQVLGILRGKNEIR